MSFKPKPTKHPVPWMESRRVTSSHDLQAILNPGGVTRFPTKLMDEVYPSVFIGEQAAAMDLTFLQENGITHVLNAAHGKGQAYSNTSHVLYKKAGIKYLGIPAEDSPTYNMMVHFEGAANFIHNAVKQSGGKVLVHCRVGISRSATLVLAYLMTKQNIHITEAVTIVRNKREVSPNIGFLNQLCKLQQELDYDDDDGDDGLGQPKAKQISTTTSATGIGKSRSSFLACLGCCHSSA